MPSKAKLPDLEKSLAELDKIMDKMDQDDISLDQSLKHFERGIDLIQHSRKLLEKAEQKITRLTDKS